MTTVLIKIIPWSKCGFSTTVAKLTARYQTMIFFRKIIGGGEVQQGLSKWSSITYEELDVIEPKSGKERVGQDP